MSVGSKEAKALLELTKYFQDHWVIFDVGSNKGAWSDILMNYRDGSTEAGKYTVHMFEPNDMLLNYTRVKYDYNKNIVFNNKAVFRQNGMTEFFYFTNENSGLSSVHHNPKWDYLPMQQKMVITNTLDSYVQSTLSIDIVKIDIEGAEYDALLGCKGLMQGKRVKFFQIEYSEHYKLTDRGFKDVIKFAEQFGYSAWKYDGEYFVKIKEEEFEENYELDNFYLSYIEIGRYHYTQLWNSEFIKNTEFLKGKVKFALEIGCFEGLTSNYICDHLLMNKVDCRMICIDPLEDMYLPDADAATNAMFVGQYERFMRNTKGQPIELQRGKSCDLIPLLLSNYRFDFVYVDGDHSESAVNLDCLQALSFLRIGGHILIDDYEWSAGTKRGIDSFLSKVADRISIIHKGYQVLIKRIA